MNSVKCCLQGYGVKFQDIKKFIEINKFINTLNLREDFPEIKATTYREFVEETGFNLLEDYIMEGCKNEIFEDIEMKMGSNYIYFLIRTKYPFEKYKRNFETVEECSRFMYSVFKDKLIKDDVTYEEIASKICWITDIWYS